MSVCKASHDWAACCFCVPLAAFILVTGLLILFKGKTLLFVTLRSVRCHDSVLLKEVSPVHVSYRTFTHWLGDLVRHSASVRPSEEMSTLGQLLQYHGTHVPLFLIVRIHHGHYESCGL